MIDIEARAHIARLEAEFAAFREQSYRQAGRRARPTDVDLIRAVIASPSGAVLFSSLELWRHAHEVGGPLEATLTACRFRDHWALGRRLGKIVDATLYVDGWRLVRVGRDAGGCIWQLQRQSDATDAVASFPTRTTIARVR